MKKRMLPMCMLLAVLLLGLSACGNKPAVDGQDSPAPQETTADAPEAAEEETNEEAAETAQAGTGQESAAEAAPADMTAADAADAAAAEESAPGSNTLVIYFSRVGNTDFPADVDADSSASIRVDENGLMGNAGQMAAWIAEEAGCETMEIQTEDSYPVSYEETVDQAKQEQSEAVRPALKADEKTVEDYDNIYLVFPNWWGDLPMPVYSFLDAHDLAGKTVNVFVTHEGSRFSNTVGTIQSLEPDARVQEGLAVQGGSVSDEEQNIRQWVKDHQN